MVFPEWRLLWIHCLRRRPSLFSLSVRIRGIIRSQSPALCGVRHFQERNKSPGFGHYAQPVIASRRLYLRGTDSICCYDLCSKSASPLCFQDYAPRTDGNGIDLKIRRSDGLPISKERANQAKILTTTNLSLSPGLWTLVTPPPSLSNGVLILNVPMKCP